MDIRLKSIVPEPIKNSIAVEGEIWQRDLVLQSSSFVHVLAPSGSGKSTLIGILYGTRQDYEGSLFYGEQKCNAAESADWSTFRKNDLAIVFQDLQLLNDLTALENIWIKNQLTNHYSLSEIKNFARDLGIETLLDKKVAFLSRGERQRVAILRSICMPFKWILLDEPFSALDEVNSNKAAELIGKAAKQNNAGVIMANLYADNHFEYDCNLKMI